jgi:hypothetical protein
MTYFKYIGLIIGIILLLSPISAIKIDDPQYRVDRLVPNETSPNIIHPGDDVDIWLKITNDDYDKEVKDIKITITPHYPFEIKQVNPIKGEATISHLNNGESDIAYFKLHVDEDAPSMNYRIDVHITAIEYEKKDDELVENEVSFTKIYYLPVYGIAKFELKTDENSSTIKPSETGALKITLKNKGTGVAKYLTVDLSGSENVNIVGPTTFYLKSMKPNENKLILTKIYATTKVEDGIYPITAKMSWIGEDGQEYSSTIPINIKVVKPIYSNSVFLYLDSYTYGTTGSEITIGVANRGSTTMRHCVLEISGVNELNNNYIKYIGDLDEDDYDTISYDIEGKLNETIPVKVQLTYFDDYHNEYVVSKTFNISFDSRLDEKPSMSSYYILIVIAVILLIIYYTYKRKKRKELEEDFEE